MENPWKSQKHIHNMFHDFPLKTANIHCRVWLLEGSQSCTIQYIIMSWQLQARPSSAVKLRTILTWVAQGHTHRVEYEYTSLRITQYCSLLGLSKSIIIWIINVIIVYFFKHTCFFSYSNWNHKQQKQQQKQHQLVPWDAGNHKIPETPGHLWDFPWKTNEMTGCINTIHVQSIEIRQISIDHWGSEHGLQYIYI